MQKTKRFILCLLSLVPIVTYSAPTTTVEASSETKADNGLNIKFTGENSWEYIQEREGETYKIIEEINPETGEVNSIIKKQNDKGKFILEKKLKTTHTKEGIKFEKNQNGVKTTKTLKSVKTEETKKINNLNEVTVGTFGIVDPTDELTAWRYSYSQENSINFAAVTFGIVTTTIARALKIPANKAWLYGVSTTIVSSFIPTVHTYKVRYYKNVKGTTILAGIKDYNSVYKYGGRNVKIGPTDVVVDCASGFVCEY